MNTAAPQHRKASSEVVSYNNFGLSSNYICLSEAASLPADDVGIRVHVPSIKSLCSGA